MGDENEGDHIEGDKVEQAPTEAPADAPEGSDSEQPADVSTEPDEGDSNE